MKPWILVRNEHGLMRLGGRSVLDRILEMLRWENRPAAGVICPDEMIASVEEEIRAKARDCRVLPASAEPADLADADELLLLVDGDMVYDPRLLHLATRWTEPTVLVDSAPPVTRHDRPRHAGKTFVGLAVVRAAGLGRGVQIGSVLDYSGHLDQLTDARTLDVADLPRYSPPHRRAFRHFWIQVADEEDVKRAKKMMVVAGGKGHQELAVLIFNRPVETFLSYYVCDWRVTPNQITIIGNIIAYGTTAFFALGYFWWGILVALATEVMDGLDGRQARIQIKTSRLGEFEHVLDKIHEISWMFALAWYFSTGFSDLLYLWLTLGWVVAHNLDNLSYSVFRAKRGMVIDEATKFDAAVRLFASNRNNNILFLAIGLLLGYPLETYWFILAWSVVTLVIHWIRVALLLSKPVAH